MFNNIRIGNEYLISQMMYQVLQFLNYIHNKGIVHRDLTPENIIVLKNQIDMSISIKMIDFGSGKYMI